ncbi:hypothetical protein SAMN05428944_6413 [Streptomyces sp. 1222.5]|uniref:hypothetical protein n=1 Tax=unclassified Streptomyces TaxID=2593676 RepID=UPI000898BA24|nr:MULTISPECIES: hypothetical protein [unclassified Streptomyces]PKW06533.1 hypothetical protein BX260_1682 [Streptomyces sp. 5112.2]SED10773.1 hypothetical protein SAMN05428944_6413 [Streptomyces sp. 1222.5]
MSPTSPSASARAGLAAALLVPAAFLGGCALTGGDGCHGTGGDLKRLAAEPVLGTAPARAAAPANYRGTGVTTGCDDDSSGAPWLHADRLYAFPGGPGDVVAHYTRAAAAAGWRPERDPSGTAAPASVEGACWTRTEHGRHLLLTVDFPTGSISPAPEVGSGIAFEVSVGSKADGSGGDEATCWH